MLISILMALGCATEQPAQQWSQLPASAYCASAEVHARESCRIDECRSVIQRAGPPSASDVPSLALLCDRVEASNSKVLRPVVFKPAITFRSDLALGMRQASIQLPTSAAQKKARSAISRFVGTR